MFKYCSLCLLLSWAEDAPPIQDVNSSNVTHNLSVASSNDEKSDSDKDFRDSGTGYSAVQSSFEEVIANNGKAFSQSEFAFADIVSQNSGVPNE